MHKWTERAIILFLLLCTTVSAFIVGGVLFIIIKNIIPFFSQVSPLEFFTGTEWTPLFLKKKFGVLPLVTGTLLTTLIGLSVAIPAGLILAILLNEYLERTTRNIIKSVLEILAFIPTVVYGYFALVLLTPLLQKLIPDLQIFNALSAGLVMGIMLLPLFTSMADDAIAAVPNHLREAGYGLGASTLQIATRIVLPAAKSGILAGALIALVRALGETMIVTIAAGQVPNMTLDPREPVLTLTAYVVQVTMGDVVYGSIEYLSIYSVALVLVLLVGIATALAFYLRKKSIA